MSTSKSNIGSAVPEACASILKNLYKCWCLRNKNLEMIVYLIAAAGC